jgi:hypothetical protein
MYSYNFIYSLLLFFSKVIENKSTQASVAHAYNSSYLKCRDWENRGSSPAQANSSQVPVSKITKQNGLEVWLK